MADFALRPLSLGETLDRAFTVYRHRFGAIVIAVLLCMLIPVLMMANSFSALSSLSEASAAGSSPEESMKVAFAIMGRMMRVGLVFLAALVVARSALGWIAHKALLGDEVDAFGGLTMGFKIFLPMLGLSLLEGAIYMAATMALYIPGIFLFLGDFAGAGAGAAPSMAAMVKVFLWMFLVAGVNIWLICSFFVTSPVLLAESDATVFRSIERSWNLTKGRRLQIFGGMAVIFLLGFLVQMGMTIVVGIMAAGGGGAATTGSFLALGIMMLVNLFLTGYYYVFQMVVYYDLRVRKEGLDLELASEAMAPA